MTTKEHWESVYRTRKPNEVGWFQERLEKSLELILRSGVQPADPFIDIGGGASTLVDDLLARGFRAISVLDISSTALQAARERLGEHSPLVTWLEGDVTDIELPPRTYAVWHDRAVFHFLIRPEDRQRYVEQVREAVRRGGHVVVATFAIGGPKRCSGLEVVRYSPESLGAEFGRDFELLDHSSETHRTPAGVEQKFMYVRLQKK